MVSIEETPPAHGLAAYRRVLRTPGVAAMVTASVIARLPVGMGAVALVIYVHAATGSFAAAGVAAGAFTIGIGITGPLLARLIDRRGSRPVVLPAALVSSAALVAVVVLGHGGAGAAPLAVAAGVAGVAAPPLVTVAHLEPSDHPAEQRRWAGALVSPGIRLLVLTGIPMGATFGALDVAFPAFGTLHGDSALGGPLVAALALGSALGGLAYGLRPTVLGPPRRAFLRLSPLQALTCAPVLLAATVPEMFLAAAVAGLCVAPLTSVRNQLVQVTMPPGTGAEAFTWMGLSITVGASAGSALAGPLVEAGGWRAGAVAACAIPAAGAVLALARRGALRAP